MNVSKDSILILPFFLSLIVATPANSQLIPDNTLGAENSTVTTDGMRELIQDGAIRDAVLFHSFQEFNVNDGQQVYFSNPQNITDILTRVTGNNSSQILGTLGVDGNANLFLINPNGIHFGENARLDVGGSFTASTADSIIFDNFEYSATNPEVPPLLTVNVPLGIQWGENHPSRLITNQGILQVPGDLTLRGGNLDLKGILTAGGNLTLWGLGEIRIRDSIASPFIASAGEELLVQGNEKIDIFALNHPDSGLFSGGDMVLRSRDAVGGDAHYFSGGSVRIEQLDGELGELYSPDDPVIVADEDVYLASYTGASLHIFAGGLVWIPGTITINAPDTVDFIAETVTLSDGSTIDINGSARPTLDIRAGIDWNQLLGAAPGDLIFGAVSPFLGDLDSTSSSADIVLGNVVVSDIATGNGGQVFLSNQYFPNAALGTNFGGISIRSIDTRDLFGGGSVTIDARSEINVDGTVDASAFDLALIGFPANTYVGNGSDIKLLSQGNTNINSYSSLITRGNAGGNITLDSGGAIDVNRSLIASQSYGTLGGSPTGGDVLFNGVSLVLEDGAQIGSVTYGEANAGQVVLNVNDTIRLQGEDILGNISGIFSQVAQTATGDAGGITINTGNLELLDGATVDSSTSGQGNAARVVIDARDTIRLQGESNLDLVSRIFSQVEPTATGNAGEITINTGNLELFDGARVSSSTLGQGNAAQVAIDARDTIRLQGESSLGDGSAVFSRVEQTATGNAGGVTINTGNLELLDGATVDSSTLGQGNAAQVAIHAHDTIRVQGENSLGFGSAVFSQVGQTTTGNAGGVTIETGSLELLDGAQINSNTLGQGNAARVAINARDTIRFEGKNSLGFGSAVLSRVEQTATGDAGGITIETGSLELLDGATVDSSTFGQGNAAQIEINARDTIRLQGESSFGFGSAVGSQVGQTATGDAGGVTINTGNLELADGATVDSSTLGQGNAAQIEINARDTIRLQGSDSQGFRSAIVSQVGQTAKGDAGGVTIETGNLDLLNGTGVDSSTLGQGSAARVAIHARNNIRLQGTNSFGFGSTVFSRVASTATGNAGGIKIETGNLELFDGAGVDSSTLGQGNAAQVEINARDTIRLQGEDSLGFVSGVFSRVEQTAKGDAGGVTIETGNFELLDGAGVDSSTYGQGNAARVAIHARNNIRLQGENSFGFGSTVFSRVASTATGDAGGVTIETGSLELLNGAGVDSSTYGQGNAARVTIHARNNIRLQGEDSLGFVSGVFSRVEQTAKGDAGGITIETGSLELLNGGRLDSSTFAQGNAAQVTINARNNIRLQGESQGNVSAAIFSQVASTATGDAGGVTIETRSLELFDGATVDSSTRGQGNAARVAIHARDIIRLQGESSQGFVSAVASRVEQTATGDAGGITIETGSLEILDGARVDSSTLGQGNAAQVAIHARDTIRLQGKSSQSAVASRVEQTATGDAGGIIIETGSLEILDGARVDSSTLGQGNAAQVAIHARDTIRLQGESSQGLVSVVISGVYRTATGDAGGVTIETGSLKLLDGARVDSGTLGQGNAAQVAINARDTIRLQGENSLGFGSGIGSTVGDSAIGDAGGVEIDTGSLELLDGALIDSSTLGQGNAAQVAINTRDTIRLQGKSTSQGFVGGVSSIVGETATGDAGGVTIDTGSLELFDGALIDSSTYGQGNAGNIFIVASNTEMTNSAAIGVVSQSAGRAGNINIYGDNLTLRNNSIITAETLNVDGGNININLNEILLMRHGSNISTTAGTAQAGGNGGNITINAGFIVAVPHENNDITANAFEGNGGNIDITTNGLFGIAPRSRLTPLSDITASSQFGLNGSIDITLLAPDPSSGLNELPLNLVEAELNDRCQSVKAGGEESTSFVITGRGGIPTDPARISPSSAIAIPLATFEEEGTGDRLPSSEVTAIEETEGDRCTTLY